MHTCDINEHRLFASRCAVIISGDSLLNLIGRRLPDTPDRPIRNDDKDDDNNNKECDKDSETSDDKNIACKPPATNCANLSNNARTTEPQKSQTISSPNLSNARRSDVVENKPEEDKGPTSDLREMAVAEFSSFVGLLENGLSVSYSIFGNDGEPIGGRSFGFIFFFKF